VQVIPWEVHDVYHCINDQNQKIPNHKLVSDLENFCPTSKSRFDPEILIRYKNETISILKLLINQSKSLISVQLQKTVFVGALHGMLTAEALFTIMNDLFGGVVYAGIDSDRYKYPIGSGRVTFDNEDSFMRAVSAAFVNVESQKFSKKVRKPVIEA
jgi:hypothetical protein